MRRTKTRGVTPKGPGSYEIRFVFLDPKTGLRREGRQTVEARTVGEANEIRLHRRHAAIEGRQPAKQRKTTLAASTLSWLGSSGPALRASTLATYKTACARWTTSLDERKTPLGSYFVEALEPGDIEAAMARWSRADLHPGTINAYLRVLRTWAKRTRNGHVVEGVRALPNSPGDPDAAADQGRRSLTLPELRRFLRAGPKYAGRWWPMLATLAYTGMRWGEVSALRWPEVDLAAATIRVRRSQVRGVLGKPKTIAGIRDVSLPDALVRILRAERRRARDLEGLVFPPASRDDSDPEYRSNTGARKAALRVFAAAKIEIGDRPAIHCLRHSWSNLLRQTSTSRFVREALIGHANEESGVVYSAAEIRERRKAVRAAERAVRGRKR